jgi:hypothetical protein
MNARDILDDAAVHGWAYRCAERGWHVFPTRPDGKEPRRGLLWAAVATADLSRLARATWRPGENYGIAAKPSGLVVVDLDKPKPGYVLPARWREWADEPGIVDGRDVLAVLAERAVQQWPHTFTVTTPSGGAHLYYTAPAGRSIGNKQLGPLIDIRGGKGDGGYVLGPGSILGGRRYEVTDDQDPQLLPGWIADLLDPPPGVKQTAGRPIAGTRYGRLRGLVQTVLDSAPGNRNGPLYWAACRAGEMVRTGEVDQATAERVLVEAALEAGLRGGEPEARRTIASGFRQVAA